MTMTTCSQCNWWQLVVWYLVLLYEKNRVIFKQYERVLSLLVLLLYIHVHDSKFMHYIDILHSWMFHSCRNKTCIKFRDRFWFAIRGAFCQHEQRIKMMQMLPFHLKEPLKLIETLTRLSYCIVVSVDSRSLQTISVKIAWSFEPFVVLHQVNPHWHRYQHPAFGRAESSQRCRL